MTDKEKTTAELIQEINSLKKQKNACLLVHNYQIPEIYKVADFIGDSLDLSRKAAETPADIIVFCGVDFMAETAKILNPEKTVLIPTKEANCPMAAMATAEEVQEMKQKFPKAAVVSYVNTSAEVKAVSDICCTSANAVKIVNSLPNKQVIFVPDENLAAYVATQSDKEIIHWKGYCYVHAKFSAEELKQAKEAHPEAEVIVHPECKMEVIELADAVESTSGMLRYVKESDEKEFIIGTEIGLIERLKLEFPEKKFYSAGITSTCIQMKKNSLQKILRSLEENIHKVELPKEIIENAKKPIERMLEVK